MIDRLIDAYLASPLNFTVDGMGFFGSALFLAALVFTFTRTGNRGD